MAKGRARSSSRQKPKPAQATTSTKAIIGSRKRWQIGGLVAVGILFLAVAFYFTATKLEENDAFCASCHSEPESTYYKRTQDQAAVDLASVHAHLSQTNPNTASTRCIDCHAGPGFSGRAHAVSLGARDAVRWIVGTANQPAVLTQPPADANCLKCHTDVPNQRSFNAHFHRFLSQWQQKDATAGTCISCHTSHTTDGSARIAFLQQQRTQAVCEACHVALVKRE